MNQNQNKKKRMAWWIIPLVVIVAAVGGLLYFRSHPVQVKAEAIDLTKVHTTKVVEGTLNSTLSTTGTLRTNQSVNLSWKTGGQVAQVNVKVGDTVTVGEILAQLDPASNVSFATLQANLLTAQENLASLQDTTVAVATAKIALIQAQSAVASAQKAVDALQVTPTQAQIDAAYATTLQDQKMVDRLQVAFNILASNPETDLERANALNALNTAIQKQNQDVGAYNQLINHTPDAAALATAQSNLSVAQQKLAVAQANETLASAGPDATKIASAQVNIDQIEANLDQQYLRATVGGTVTSVAVQVGDLVSSGTAAVRIDDMSSLYLDLQVSEVDLPSVQIGQTVELSFTANADQAYTGQVTAISTTGSVAGGVATYSVTVELSNADNQASSGQAPPGQAPPGQVRPGMTATADIVTAQLSQALLVPNLSVATLNGQKVVYVMAGGTMTPENVTVSLSSDTQTAVVGAGLKAGDAIVTNPVSLAAPAATGLKGLLLKLGVIAIS